jgi:hypothetical protein
VGYWTGLIVDRFGAGHGSHRFIQFHNYSVIPQVSVNFVLKPAFPTHNERAAFMHGVIPAFPTHTEHNHVMKILFKCCPCGR